MGLDSAQMAAKLRMFSVPLPGREAYELLRHQWQTKGYTRLLEIGLEYITNDVRPLLDIVLKFKEKFKEENICVFKDYVSLPVSC